YFAWADPETSVINTSLIFWSLTSVLSGRHALEEVPALARGDDPPSLALDPPMPSPVASPSSATGATARRGVQPLPASTELAPTRDPRDLVDRLLIAGADASPYCGQVGRRRSRPKPPGVMPPAAALSRVADGRGDRAWTPLALDAPPTAGSNPELRFALPVPGTARIVVFDAGGRRV